MFALEFFLTVVALTCSGSALVTYVLWERASARHNRHESISARRLRRQFEMDSSLSLRSGIFSDALKQMGQAALDIEYVFSDECCTRRSLGRHARACTEVRRQEREFVAGVAGQVYRSINKFGVTPETNQMVFDMAAISYTAINRGAARPCGEMKA